MSPTLGLADPEDIELALTEWDNKQGEKALREETQRHNQYSEVLKSKRNLDEDISEVQNIAEELDSIIKQQSEWKTDLERKIEEKRLY